MIFLGVGATDGLIAPTYENTKVHIVAVTYFAQNISLNVLQ